MNYFLTFKTHKHMTKHTSSLQEGWQAFKERTRKSDKQINQPAQTFTKGVCMLIARQVVANSLTRPGGYK